MPVIRYRTRDLTRLVPGIESVMRRICRIGARTDDMMIIRGVNVFPSQIEEQILKCAGLAPHFMIELSRTGRMDQMKVIVEAREACDCSADAATLIGCIKDHIGVTALVDVCAPGSLERSQGKAQRVRDLRPKD